eukprot:8487564-Pyramimonas_sp.AAC.1
MHRDESRAQESEDSVSSGQQQGKRAALSNSQHQHWVRLYLPPISLAVIGTTTQTRATMKKMAIQHGQHQYTDPHA